MHDSTPINPSGQVFKRGLLGCQIDSGIQHSRSVLKSVFNRQDTGTAVHPLDIELQGRDPDRVASSVYPINDGLDLRLCRVKVDVHKVRGHIRGSTLYT